MIILIILSVSKSIQFNTPIICPLPSSCSCSCAVLLLLCARLLLSSVHYMAQSPQCELCCYNNSCSWLNFILFLARKSRKGSLSPPTYSVESDGKGNLISCKYRVGFVCFLAFFMILAYIYRNQNPLSYFKINWPKRPTEGKHSIEAEMELRVGIPKSAGNSKTALDTGRRSSEQVAERSVVGQNQELIKKYQIAVCPGVPSTVYSIRTMSMEVSCTYIIS